MDRTLVITSLLNNGKNLKDFSYMFEEN